MIECSHHETDVYKFRSGGAYACKLEDANFRCCRRSIAAYLSHTCSLSLVPSQLTSRGKEIERLLERLQEASNFDLNNLVSR
eukprot:767135-Hanusia_phi.AAC.1